MLCDYFIYTFLRQDIANGSIKYLLHDDINSCPTKQMETDK